MSAGSWRGGDAVADALDMEQFDGFADFLGATDLAGVHQEMKAIVGSLLVDRTKILGRHAHFVAADAEGHDRFGAAIAGPRLTTSMAASAPNCRAASKIQFRRSPSFFKGFGGLQNCFEIGFGPLFAKQHHSDRESDLGVDHPLR